MRFSSVFRLVAPIGGRPLLVLLLCVSAPLPAYAQPRLDVAAARQYAQSLESNFWEQAWVDHLSERAGANGTLDWAYGDRQQLSELTNDYQRAIGEVEGFWTNLQVQDYLQRQLLTVQPNPMMPGRPGAFRLRVLSTTTPNALALNDGTILLTTGLITTLETAAQLRAILAHEVAHIVLDHALATYRAGQKRSRARNLLGTLIGGVTSVVTPGLGRRPIESTVYGLSSDLATKYLDREFIAAAGLKYSPAQEAAANRLAQKWLLAQDQPPGALHSALQTLQRAGTYTSVTHGASFLDTHPSSNNRRAELGDILRQADVDPSALDASPPGPDSTYDTQITAVLEHEAEMDLSARRFHSALGVLNRTLRTEWTTPQTFLYKAIAIRNTTATPNDIQDAFVLLNQAEAASDAPEPRIEAERALLQVRQGNIPQARRHLALCQKQIDTLRAGADRPQNLIAMHDSLYAWAARMEVRLRP
ncbi:hypothetical protein BSZ35_08910 [Salinibacter sp. 10B]|uniref:M48 family metalloprotease n=1 Tax=Salinibacter sp. 10B TaxID=1923971 RepID=UPI000CF3F8C5|nr:M48 family metalloprotease [Salinibacter sp. 10B]PQJ34702.1 hypothetical protein BSZ35_08910 [Salinibacter sp. 10B]